jgi:hypothetical protein
MSYLKSAFLLLTIFSFQVASAQNDEEAVKQTVNRLFAGMKASDTAMVRSAFSSGAILQTVIKNREGKVLVRTEAVDSFVYFLSKPHTEVYDERIVFDVVKIDGDLATVWTPYQFYLGQKFQHCGVNSFQLVRLNGEWKIQYLIDTRRRQSCQ